MKANEARGNGVVETADGEEIMGKTAVGKSRGRAHIKQLHLKYTCQRAVIVKAAPAVHCTLPDPRPVKYAMLDQKGVLLWPTPDPRSVKALPSHITRPRVTWA